MYYLLNVIEAYLKKVRVKAKINDAHYIRENIA